MKKFLHSLPLSLTSCSPNGPRAALVSLDALNLSLLPILAFKSPPRMMCDCCLLFVVIVSTPSINCLKRSSDFPESGAYKFPMKIGLTFLDFDVFIVIPMNLSVLSMAVMVSGLWAPANFHIDIAFGDSMNATPPLPLRLSCC